MHPRGRRIVPVVVVVLVVVASAVVLVGANRLDDHIAELDRRWMPLRSDLAIRYEKLQTVNALFRDEYGDNSATRQLRRGLDDWSRLRRAERVDPGAEVDTANALEVTAHDLLHVTQRSIRRPSSELEEAFVAFTQSPLPLPELPRYNREVLSYERTRDSVIGAPAAHLLGFYGRALLGLTL